MPDNGTVRLHPRLGLVRANLTLGIAFGGFNSKGAPCKIVNSVHHIEH